MSEIALLLVAERSMLLVHFHSETVVNKIIAQVSQQFSSRIRDLQYWRTNLDNKSAEVGAEIDALIQCQSQLQRMYHSCAGKCSINQQMQTILSVIPIDRPDRHRSAVSALT